MTLSDLCLTQIFQLSSHKSPYDECGLTEGFRRCLYLKTCSGICKVPFCLAQLGLECVSRGHYPTYHTSTRPASPLGGHYIGTHTQS